MVTMDTKCKYQYEGSAYKTIDTQCVGILIVFDVEVHGGMPEYKIECKFMYLHCTLISSITITIIIGPILIRHNSTKQFTTIAST